MANAEPIDMPAAAVRRPAVLARFARFGRAAFRLVLDAALTPLCAACRSPLGEQGGLCPTCWSKVSFIAPPYCERLGIPFAFDPGPGVLSMEAIADPPAAPAPVPPCVSTMSRATSSTG
jgi:hypothetical protein